MHTPWTRKPLLVEWDLTGDENSSFGAVVFLAAAPVRIVKRLEATYASEADVIAAVDEWLASVAGAYVVNVEFQDFKTTARRVDEESHPARRAGQWWRPLD